jgi:hypothetical protein
MPNGNASFLCVSGLFGGQRQEIFSRRLQSCVADAAEFADHRRSTT